jgi:lipoprotein-anchoring transpeptidase ErfK/SrfK
VPTSPARAPPPVLNLNHGCAAGTEAIRTVSVGNWQRSRETAGGVTLEPKRLGGRNILGPQYFYINKNGQLRLMHYRVALFVALVLLPGPVVAAPLDVQAVNDAQWRPQRASKEGLNPIVIKAQVLLDRAHFSPGEIDGKLGDNFKKAIRAFSADQGLPPTDVLTEEVWQALNMTSADPVVTEYAVTQDDVRGPFTKRVPAKMEEMKDLPALAYTNAREKIAEKFHMSQELLSILNPRQEFGNAGDRIMVANVASSDLPKAGRIEVDKSTQMLRVFGRDQELLAVYPATAGSAEKPAPSGRLKVTAVSRNPTYRYNPAYAFKGVRASKPFTIKPGPNNPVGIVWIGLSSEGYGIHGTPDPSKVSKTQSHGCIRLTNWDALQLASAVAKGTPVDFVSDEQLAHKTQKNR